MAKWELKRDQDNYWYWTNGNDESPIFCVRKLAMEWRKARRALDKVASQGKPKFVWVGTGHAED